MRSRPWRRTVVLSAVALTALLAPRIGSGTVAEQRARLPPPAFCESPVEGIWRSHAYSPAFHDWTEFTLEIRRVPESQDKLTGGIKNHNWEGGPEDEQPPKCVGDARFRVSMEATGTFKDGEVSFRGTSWKLDEVVCGALGAGWGYNLDHFTGKIDYDRQEFQSVNNDGGRDVNVPFVFRRIKCFDPPPPPRVAVTPPPFFPKPKAAPGGGGCSGGR